ncbi:sororin isoform X2 [Mustelus asterias]
MAARGGEAEREEQDLRPPARRKSDRLSATESKENSVQPLKRSIVLKRIEPQKHAILGETRQSPTLTKSVTAVPRRSPRISAEAVKENVCLGDSARSEAGQPHSTPTALSPPAEEAGAPPVADRSTVMSQKVRRSYSRLSPFGVHALNTSRSFGESPRPPSDASDTSTPNQPAPSSRRSFFGFDRLLAADTTPGVSPVKPLTPKEAELSARVAPATAPLDVDIPGIPVAKGKKKKRKVPQIEKSELDEWAAQMNATFEEAERFDLLVE